MALGDRSKKIRQNVQNALGDPRGNKFLYHQVYDALNRIQRRIAEDAMCIEDSTEINVFQGQETYPFPDEMISERTLVPSDATELKQVSMDEVNRLKRRSSSNSDAGNDLTSDNLHFYYKWGGEFGFLLADGSAPTATDTVTVYFWRYPESVEEMTDFIDPLVDGRWDSALQYGAIAELSGDAKWWTLFEAEMERNRARERASRTEALRIEPTTDYD